MKTKKSVLIITVLAIIVGGFLLLRFTPQNHQQMQGSLIADKVFALQLNDYNGKPISLADFKGRPLVINSWAAWCPFCVQELKDFAAVQDEFEGRVVIIAINRAEPLAVAKKFADDLGVTGRLIFLQDPTDSFYKSISGFAMPETIFIDARGMILDHQRGSMNAVEIRQRVSALLQ